MYTQHELAWREAFAYADCYVATDDAINYANYYVSTIDFDDTGSLTYLPQKPTFEQWRADYSNPQKWWYGKPPCEKRDYD